MRKMLFERVGRLCKWFNNLTLICSLLHRKHWTHYGHGDWRVQECMKCDNRWAVPTYAVKGRQTNGPL